MLLFKSHHVPWILYKSPHTGEPKTLTNRFWKQQRAREGSIHKAKTQMLSKTYFAKLKIIKSQERPLGDLTAQDARKEGYPTIDSYLRELVRINHEKILDGKRVGRMRRRELLALEPYRVEYEVTAYPTCLICGNNAIPTMPDGNVCCGECGEIIIEII